jgi:predicted secreted protein
MKIRVLLEEAGVSLLILCPQVSRLLSPDHLTVYHHDLPLANVACAIFLEFLAVFLVTIALGWLALKLSPTSRKFFEACAFSFLIWWILRVILPIFLDSNHDNNVAVFQSDAKYFFWVRLFTLHTFLITSIATLIFGFLTFSEKSSRWCSQTAHLCLASFAMCGLWVAPELIGLAVEYPNTPNFDHTDTRPPRTEKRIVWILFDELSYRLAIEHTPEGTKFPNFQSFHSESISFGNLAPAGMYTDRVIPSILSGNRFDQIKSSLDGRLFYLDQRTGHWAAYDPEQSLFGLADRSGWNPAVAGWYNPYCRIFIHVLSRCSWKPLDGDVHLHESSEHPSVLSNALAVPQHYLDRALSHSGPGALPEDKLRRFLSYQAIMEDSAALIGDGQVRFIFIHIPVPHPPGIFDRRTHQFSAGGSYLDNLVLADDALGQLLQEIGKTPWASETAVIVSSDHSWRVPLWRNGPDWTSEDQTISGGDFDARPVFLVHYPGQTNGVEISAPESEMLEHDIVAAMLDQTLQNPDDLSRFVRDSHLAPLATRADAR